MASTVRSSLPPGFRIDARLGAIYDVNQPDADDLTIIRGIETRESVGLNHLGIYYFDQLAAWTDHQITLVADMLGMSASTIFRQRWTDQACALIGATVPGSAPSPLDQRRAAPWQTPMPEAPPASGSRTVTVLVCALLAGCFLVSWLNRQSHEPMYGILAADLSSLRVPADARLLTSHVAAGDEVFTGETLLTLEKLEHLELIAQQTQRVHTLARELKRAQVQASMDLRWRQQALEHEVSETTTRGALFENLQPTITTPTADTSFPNPVLTVSSPRSVGHDQLDRANSLLFISGLSGGNTLDTLNRPAPDAGAEPVPATQQPAPTGPNGLQLEVQKVRARLQQLEQLRSELPDQVRLAAGVETLRAQHSEATARLTQMENLSRESAIICPGYGTIGQVRYRPGDRMARGEVMLKILHTDRRFVIVDVPTEQLQTMQPGAPLRVRFHDHDECRGVVTDMPMLAGKSAGQHQTTTSVRVEATGRRWPEVPIGSIVTVLRN